ncbi:AmmeMemoRadiSam system protein A [Uliginosibacterium sp. H1]|uniref:AmmeMemoRadiSam system protein A n=1 Tax=Uliginosibacterium sp. H1 TaxID=3114757 RepID=UPI002E1834FF|nr:AmmeMemoRadiSam system protein A [Uliginosibacterium sp. H1]
MNQPAPPAPSSAAVSPALGTTLLALARNAIAERLALPQMAVDAGLPALQQRGATFVTLQRAGALRGCIGQLQASRPLLRDVQENARAAAFRDPRFPPLTAAEWPGLEVEVSLLGDADIQPCPTREEALQRIVAGQDGIILSGGCRSATFLPQVWEQLPEPQRFLDQLLLKAGLRNWPDDMLLGRYRVEKFSEG